jgi:hypothetical protein
MEHSQGKPTLRPMQRKDGSWCAEASWPNAPTEDVGHFKSKADVLDWIIHKANDYFRQREGG